jgi:hypothetical protein
MFRPYPATFGFFFHTKIAEISYITGKKSIPGIIQCAEKDDIGIYSTYTFKIEYENYLILLELLTVID